MNHFVAARSENVAAPRICFVSGIDQNLHKALGFALLDSAA